ncbi:LOW QUALITY PROTEIN: hypothetical protein V2J09_011909 [Rumex salicifolius]
MNMGVVVSYGLMDRLRQLVGLLECVDCCCGGSYEKSSEEGGVGFAEMTSTMTPCKDAMFEHPRMRCCDLLSQLPPSLPLDGINAEEMVESKVLIPVPGGLVEFYASKMVPEDQSLIDYVVSQCNTLSEQGVMINVNNNNNMNVSQVQTGDFSPYSPSTALANLDLSCGEATATATADRIRICNSAMNFLQQFSYLTETPCSDSNNKDEEDDNNDVLLAHAHGAPPTHDHTRTRSRSRSHFPTQLQHEIIMNGNDNEEEDGDQEEQEKGLMKQQHGAGPRGDSGSDSDPIDDEDDSKYGGGNSRRKNGKGTSKNLMAERKRRKKLNERLYLLRSLVPKISKLFIQLIILLYVNLFSSLLIMLNKLTDYRARLCDLDRAAILGDAIEYVMELQQQVRGLQNELEHNSEDDDDNSLITNTNLPSMEYSASLNLMDNSTVGEFCTAPSASSTLKRGAASHDDTNTCSVQVEVAHLDGNEFFIKVFGEQKGVSFVSLMEGLHSLGLEVTTVNGTSCISLVSYVFTVEASNPKPTINQPPPSLSNFIKKDNEVVQAEYLRESLLQMTRNQTSEWAEMAKPTGGGGGQLDQFQHNQYFQHHHFHPFQ